MSGGPGARLGSDTGTPGSVDGEPELRPAMTRPVNWTRIAEQYDQMLKYATAIRTGTAPPRRSCAGS
ncbi:Tn3 family transposase [Nocardia abscessus]|uniref:Tn3 family transposase n=1 Tax=Nocardia abscessus TaxID=120957 RepID=UPI003CC7FC2D